MSAHLDDDTLVRLLDGALHERWWEPVAAHLDACPRCAARLAALDPLTAHLQAAPAPVPPDAVLEGVLQRLRAPPEAPAPLDASRAPQTVAAALAALALAAALSDVASGLIDVGAALGAFPSATPALLAAGAVGWAIALIPHAATARSRAP